MQQGKLFLYIYIIIKLSSHTFVQEGFDLSVEFGTGALKGQINSDNLYFGDLELPA